MRIEKDATWKERRARWNLRQIIMKEKARGRRVWMMKGRVQIEVKWWMWDEEIERLRDYDGNWRKKEEDEEGKKETEENRRRQKGRV